MTDLIWIGNALLPRWFVFSAVGFVVLVIVIGWTILTDKASD